MSTINKNLQKLQYDDVVRISEEYLMGWSDLYPKYGFRIKGFNHKREEFGFEPLDKDASFAYRLEYIKKHYSMDEILTTIQSYMRSHDMDAARWSGVELFHCRFGREWAKFMKTLVGSQQYRKLSEMARVEKLTNTQKELYGGVGLAGESIHQKANATIQQRYQCDNVMKNEQIKQKLANYNLKKYGSISPFGNDNVKSKSMKTRSKIIAQAIANYKKTGLIDKELFKQSTSEYLVFLKLADKFGPDAVLYQYGVHPYDERYPFACDFYIKSLDLFIELNGYYGHGKHWYDVNNHDDVLKAQHWLLSEKRQNLNAYHMWTENDVLRRTTAAKNQLRYLVFWDGTGKKVDGHNVPNLTDFYRWFYDYDCNYVIFVRDNPENTY